MINLINDYYALELSMCPNNPVYKPIEEVSADNTDELKFAIKISFQNDTDANVEIIKKLKAIMDSEKINDFYVLNGNKRIKFVIDNYTDDLLIALKALLIRNKRKRIEFIYDYLCDYIDKLWSEKNPCQFDSNSTCIAQRMKATPYDIHGCCYSYIFKKEAKAYTSEGEVCKYLEKGRGCNEKNLSCKIFVCKYLRENHLFLLDFDSFIIPKAFFTENQILAMKYNHFKSRNEVVDKIMESEKSFKI